MMKKYIGSKQVQAEPMTKGAAFNAGLLRMRTTLPEAEKEIPGYKVVYDNGYESWSPAEVFEAAYTVAETPLDRLTIELNGLNNRCRKLSKFIFNQNDGKDFQALPRVIKADLLAQNQLMIMLSYLLAHRHTCMEDECYSCPPQLLFFEQILPMLKEGFAIRRECWGSKEFVIRQIPAHITKDIIPTMQSLPEDAKRLIMENSGFIDYTCQCLIINLATGRADSWHPSISDVMANDWELVIDANE